jgi:hypothetical protein
LAEGYHQKAVKSVQLGKQWKSSDEKTLVIAEMRQLIAWQVATGYHKRNRRVVVPWKRGKAACNSEPKVAEHQLTEVDTKSTHREEK